MKDLEICERIAEIEGHAVEVVLKRNVIIHNGGDGEAYNPLIDDALCFKFCYEDGITIQKSLSVVNGKMEWNGNYFARHPRNQGFGSVDNNPNRAVCLEKIEANKEQS